MKISIRQINTIVGDIENNKAKIIDGYKRGIVDKVDLVIFPELSLVGYPPLDLVEKKEFRQAAVKAAEEIASITGKTGLILSFLLYYC
jgi:NAD+ synthase (glutamine-hydrolysing)